MKNTQTDNSAEVLMQRKLRENRITNCCDVFRNIVRDTKVFMLVQLVIYLLLAYVMIMGAMGIQQLIRPVVCSLCAAAGAAVTVFKRDQKGNVIGIGIDIVSIAVFLFFRMIDMSVMLLLLGSLIVHGIRAEKLYCYDLIKDLYGFSRFYSFDICNRVIDDDFKAQSIVESYDAVFDNELMKYERSSHYIPPLFKRVQTAAVIGIIVGTVALAVSMAVLGKVDHAEDITEIGSHTGGSVKGTVTQIFEMSGYGSGSAEDTYWVTMGGEQVSFVVPDEYKSDFRALYAFQHAEKQGMPELEGEKPRNESVKFVGEICKPDNSKYSNDRITVAKPIEDKSDLPFNTKYYIRLYSTGLWKLARTVGIVLIIAGAAAWALMIFLGSRENSKY